MLMHDSDMPQMQVRITSRLIDSLYTEAMLLAEQYAAAKARICASR